MKTTMLYVEYITDMSHFKNIIFKKLASSYTLSLIFTTILLLGNIFVPIDEENETQRA